MSLKLLKQKKRETQLKTERVMKNVDRLYRKYYNANRSNYETNGELNGAKKKMFGYKQLELVDEPDEESKLDAETKKF